ncbi:3D domain-containing protein [Streptomyces sp. SL13]|uniref:3D domain-containing protein n=1 Tax=Streptantibioticus silvisoli TaxID=2705255 RepID=A0AA90H8H6_9ACTN|nr:3D domain-containing protein [Streptantibioticus silvisoli]MDI5962156.1 3D domain-containing protein [Streptantibioticus silvisoli]MDI5972422.1 3D domain-containing protein [Streptantibioticus silvisoli]
MGNSRRTGSIAAVFATVLAATVALQPHASAAPVAPAALPACQHFYTGPIPDRPLSPGVGPSPEIGAVDVSGRLAAPGGVSGGLNADGTVTFTFDRVPGAVAYRAFRNGQALQWIDDWGQPSFTVTDSAPCEDANYQIYAMSDTSGSASSIGQISTAYRVGADDQLAAWSIPAGTTFTYKVTSYNDTGQTALGYNAGPGFCAVDARNIPWGTRFYVPGYGYCYAADIGSWIKDDIVDVWLPGTEADDWGVQQRTLVVQ